MNEAKQAATITTMPDKDLFRLEVHLSNDVAEIEQSIRQADHEVTPAGVAEYRDRVLSRNPEVTFKLSLEEEATWMRLARAGTQSRRKARLVTRQRRLQAVREEMGKRARFAVFGSREALG